MPKEYDFMKSAGEKEMPDEEYKTLREEYDKKAGSLSNGIKKLVIALLAVYAVSLAILYLFCAFTPGTNEARDFSIYVWLAAEFLLAVFLYDPKSEEDKKSGYETDKKILLNSVRQKIKMSKIRLGLVIFFGAVFLMLNIVCWAVAGSGQSGESVDDILRLIIAQIPSLSV